MLEAVGVVIVSWNVRDLLLACLDSLAGSRRSLRVVVIDNGSSDGSVAAVAAAHPEVEVVANEANEGFTRATNQGLRFLGVLGEAPGREAFGTGRGRALEDDSHGPAPRVVVLLNPDTQVVGDALSDLADYLAGHPRAGAVGPALRGADGTAQSSRRRFPTLATGLLESTPLGWHWPRNPAVRRFEMEGVPETPGRVDWLSGAVLALRTDALREVGALDEGFFMYSEELDLCRRLADAGWQSHYLPAARVIHHEGRSSEQAVLARHLHFQRSRVRYFRKHHGRAAAAVVRTAILAGYAFEAALETLKLAAGHRAPLRRQRLATYRAVLADGLGPRIEAPRARDGVA